MPNPYAYLRVAPGAADFPPDTLGIEMTDHALAARCGLGNIDPQHGQARGALVAGDAAISVALDWPLPPRGATLVTIRPDADALGAMAVLSLRAEGVALNPGLRARVTMIARSDSFDFGDWASWSAANPPPAAGTALLPLSLHPPAVRALAAFIGRSANDLPHAVAMMRDWLRSSVLPPAGVAAVAEVDQLAADAWAAGQIAIETCCGGRVAQVRSAYPGAMALGYRYAPVVVAEGLVAGRRKLTIAQFARGHADLAALAARLNAVEPGWGGSATVIGSPQGLACEMSVASVVELLCAPDILTPN